jgi:cytochrome c5
MTARFTLRHLPLPAKLVVSAFLISVGVGYFSALVQLHMQHGDRDGNPLPTPENVIEHFSGVKKFDGDQPVSKMEGLINGDPEGGFSKANMAIAFYAKSTGYDKEVKDRGKKIVNDERNGERKLLTAWLNLSADERKAAFDDDAMVLPTALAGQPLTAEFVKDDGKTVQVKTLFEARCLKCHGEGGSNKPEMHTYAKLEPLATAPSLELLDGIGDKKWVRSTKQTTVEGLTQSTHAHLLSFSMLFGLTGLTFAFTSYPGFLRGFLGPLVLVAQLADISCWWLSRLDYYYGPVFAQAILVTGGVVGLGLSAQIVLSLFNMYGRKGKAALLALAFVSVGVFGGLVVAVIEPALAAERAKKSAEAKAAGEVVPATKK